MSRYFFDSYAIIEISKGNPAYANYQQQEIIITVFNLAEVTYSVFKEFGRKKAEEICNTLSGCCREVDPLTIIEATEFRAKHNKRKLSYADCIGYTYAFRNNIKFLTGDEQFKDLNNVEFLKK